MSALPAWLRSYAALDDAALTALANKGLLRRGRAALAAGHVRLGPVEPQAVTVEVGEPPVAVIVTPDGPRSARCPCPVAGTCVHIVTACLWLRSAGLHEAVDEPTAQALTEHAAQDSGAPAGAHAVETPSDHRTPTPSARQTTTAHAEPDALDEILAWQPHEVEAAAGAAARRRVTAALAGTPVPELAAPCQVTRTPGRVSLAWPGSPQIVIVAGLGPRGVIVSGRHSQAVEAAWRLEAVVRLFATAGRAWPWPEQDLRLQPAQRELLRTVSQSAETLVDAGLSHAGERSAAEMTRLAQQARIEALPRLARLLSDAAGHLRALADHDEQVTTSDALFRLAAAWSLAQALESHEVAPPPDLIGRGGAQETQPGPLVPLSVTWWRTPAGSRGLTARFWDCEHARVESVSTGRAAGTDPSFQRDENLNAVWGTSLRSLLASPLRLENAERRADGTLAPSTRTRVQPAGSLDDVDLEAVAAGLEALRRGPQAAGFEHPAAPPRLVLTKPSDHGHLDLDEVHQQFVWTLTGRDGQEHQLRLGPGAAELDTVAALMTRALPVLGVVAEGSTLTGLYVRLDGALTALSPSLSAARIVADSRSRRFLTRLNRRMAALHERAVVVPPPPPAGPLEALCTDVAEALTALAASGTTRPQGHVAHILTQRGHLASDLHLGTLATALQAVTDGQGPPAVLRAAAILDRLTALTA